ncbi:DL-endopeptidase inhibitor IseA family protein [Paenibacillus ferrarius]|uniref:DL-endopeptidase inhibitor IseA family protein n=1 Tax=Paenibacillus ferrarius TaxID=1469647 RepID=UPI003D27E433
MLKKKHLTMICFNLLTLILLCSCTDTNKITATILTTNTIATSAPTTSVSTTNAPITSARTTNVPTTNVPTPSTPPEKESVIPELTTNDAKALLNKAYKHYVVVITYGNEQNNFEPADEKNGYYYYSEELGSKEKLQKYLDEVFTNEVSNAIIEDVDPKIINGKLAFQSHDWSSYSAGLRVTLKIVRESKSIKSIEFNYSEEKNPEKIISSSVVDFQYLSGKGWRITSADPHHINLIF